MNKRKFKSVQDKKLAEEQMYRKLQIQKYGRELTDEEMDVIIKRRLPEIIKEREEYDKLHGKGDK